MQDISVNTISGISEHCVTVCFAIFMFAFEHNRYTTPRTNNEDIFINKNVQMVKFLLRITSMVNNVSHGHTHIKYICIIITYSDNLI